MSTGPVMGAGPVRAGSMASRVLGHTTSTMPGFRITLGMTTAWLGLLVVLPLAALVLRTSSMSAADFWAVLTDERTLAAFRLSLGAAFFAAALNGVFGLMLAWVLVRYPFPGRGFVDSLVDLPFALPTAVAGIALTAVWARSGILGSFAESLGFQVAFALPGIVLALAFVGFPFVVRTVQPVLQELDPKLEEAAAVLGAGRFYTFRRVVFPVLLPALLTGFALAFARAIGEYGSVIFIAGNMPLQTEIVPLLIVTRLEQYDYDGATALGTGMLMVSFSMLLLINLLQAWTRRGLAKS